MAVTIDGTTGVSAIQAGAVESGDLPAGSVIQVVSNTYSTATIIQSTSYIDTGLSASITPISNTSKVFVIVQLSGRIYMDTNQTREFNLNIIRNSIQVHQLKTGEIGAEVGSNNFAIWPVPSSLTYVDSPGTTSSTTYKIQGSVDDISNTTSININSKSGVSTITLMEIAG